uniref:Uncharacterized protein n=1 Tax=Oryza meridionalis TaxID=40149 RepID=A0A0E0D1Q9_9ORYZ
MEDIMGDGSSTGWTDEKHMLYINSLEESFVTRLNDGKVNSKGGHDICEGNRTDTIVAQQYLQCVKISLVPNWHINKGNLGMDELHVIGIRKIANPILWVVMHQLLSQDKKESVTMQNKRAMEPLLPPVSTGTGNLLLGQQLTRDVCPCLSSELPEQSLCDEGAEVRREQSVACGNKRLKHAATTNSGLVASPGIANLEGYYSGSSSDCDIGLLKADTASPSWKAQALRTWSV